MKLKLETPVKSLAELEINPQEILLFSKYQKSMYLIIDTLGFRIAVKNKSEWKYFDNDQKEDAQRYYDSLYRIETPITADFVLFEDFIKRMELGVYYEIDFRSYGGIRIDTHTRNGGDYFWAIYDKRNLFNRYPMQSGQTIKSFKTFDGAKKSLINEIKSFF